MVAAVCMTVVQRREREFDMLHAYLMSMEQFAPAGLKIYVLAQDFDRWWERGIREAHEGVIAGWVASSERVPCFIGRGMLFERFRERADVWIQHDDDMLWTGRTRYEPVFERIMADPQVGCVSGNWAKTPALLERKDLKDRWIEQPIVNIGGGMIYRREVTELFRDNPLPYLFDDAEIALRAYCAGYRNYRFLGSLMVHQICSSGGLQKTFRSTQHALQDPSLVHLRPCSKKYELDHNYYVIDSSDLTPEAHARHRTAAERFA